MHTFNEPTSLSKGNFEIFRVVDLNAAGREEGRLIWCVDFHPKHNVALVAGNTNVVGLYTVCFSTNSKAEFINIHKNPNVKKIVFSHKVDGTKNPHHQNVKFEKFEIRNASFSTCGQEFYVSSGLFNHFFSYDMHSGVIKKTRPCSNKSRETVRVSAVTVERLRKRKERPIYNIPIG